MKRSALLFSVILFLLIPSSAFPGNLDSPNDPSGGSGMPKLQGIYTQLDTGTLAPLLAGPFTEPAAAPGSTMCTLKELRDKAPVLDDTNGLAPENAPNGKTFWGLTSGAWGLQTGSNSNVVNTGTGDAAASDIMCGKKAWVDGVELTGTLGPCLPDCVAKTGQTTAYAIGDDGAYQKGCFPAVAPAYGDDGAGYNRSSFSGYAGFTDNYNGTVTDNVTGLIWLQDANCFASAGGIFKFDTLTWADALTWTNGLHSGDCGLSDGSQVGDWRLPNVNELRSLILPGDNLYIWLINQGFWYVQSYYYWSSTTVDTYPDEYAWRVNMQSGYVSTDYKDYTYSYYNVWPVRGGP